MLVGAVSAGSAGPRGVVQDQLVGRSLAGLWEAFGRAGVPRGVIHLELGSGRVGIVPA